MTLDGGAFFFFGFFFFCFFFFSEPSGPREVLTEIERWIFRSGASRSRERVLRSSNLTAGRRVGHHGSLGIPCSITSPLGTSNHRRPTPQFSWARKAVRAIFIGGPRSTCDQLVLVVAAMADRPFAVVFHLMHQPRGIVSVSVEAAE